MGGVLKSEPQEFLRSWRANVYQVRLISGAIPSWHMHLFVNTTSNKLVPPPSTRSASNSLHACTSIAMVKYRPMFDKLRERNTPHDDRDAIPSWLNTSCNSPSHSQDTAPPTSPRPTSLTSSPPATPPHLRKRKRPPTRQPLRPLNGNQGSPKSKRRMNNRDDNAEEQLPRELRDKAGLRKPAKYRGEEQLLYSQTGLVRELGSPQKREAKGRGQGIASSQGRTIESGQYLVNQGLVLRDGSPGNPTTPIKGQGRGSRSPTKRPQSPTKSSHASDRTGWMTRLEPAVLFLSPEECMKVREMTASARNFWLEYIGSESNYDFIPISLRVSDTISMSCRPLWVR